MGDIVKLAVRLFIFALVAAVALGITNEVTKGPIAEQALAAQMAALNKVLPGDEYAEIAYEGLGDDSLLEQIFTGTDASGEIDGYALTASPNGYGGPIPITIGVSSEGYVTQVYVGALQETAGLGSRVGTDEFMDRFIGIAADPDTLHDDVQTLSGATISSTAFLNAVDEMLHYTRDTLGISATYGDKDAILAAYAAANGGEAEEGEPAETEAADETSGNAVAYDVTGFAPFKVEIEVDGDGKIVSVAIPENGETPGFGADLIADTAVFDALVGQDIATAQIDVRAGATLTSNAINDALKQAAGANGGEAAAPAVPGDPYTVKGMNKFTLYIEVEDGKIVSISAPDHSETPGLGADLLTEEALGALVGQDLAEAKIDTVSGVTLTSGAINSALAQAAAANGIALPEPTAEPAPEPTEEPAPEPTAEPAEEPEAEPTEASAAEEPAAESASEGAEPVVVEATGFAPMKVAVAVDGEGKIVSVEVTEHGETPGLGADLIADTAVFDALVGQDIATAQIDVKSGVTLTSNAINDALKQAAESVAVEAETAEPETDEAETAEPETDEAETAEPAAAASETDEAEATEAEAAEASEGPEPVVVEVTGFAPMKVAVTADNLGKILSVEVTEHSETAGIGAALIEDASVFEALVGQDLGTAQIDVRVGATLTSNAINEALKKAAEVTPMVLPMTPEMYEEMGEGPVATVGKYEVTGFAPFTVEITVNADGTIASVTVPEHGETPGLGADLIADESVFDALVGQDIATAQIDVKSGVTLTSNAINDALKQAAKEVQ